MLGEFQKNVIYIATIILIIMLTIITYLIYKSIQKSSFPSISSVCPDYWDLCGNNVCKSNIYQNLPPSNKYNDCSGIYINTWEDYDETSKLCAKYKKAKECEISWDGISNSNIDCTLYNSV